MEKTTAVNERTGERVEVKVDGRGRVPRGYRTLTARDRAYDRGHALRAEYRRLCRAGRLDEAEQVQRTLEDAIATGVAR